MATSKESKQADKDAATTKPENSVDLHEKIRTQVEYYLSKQNLVQDTFLVQKMDKEHFVDISVIAEFKMIKQLTTDLDLIIASVKDSDQIVLDEGKKRIRPLVFNQRTTLILRNIPSDASKDAVEKVLNSASVPKIVNLRSDVGDNWFVTFETEDATKAAMELIKPLKWQEKRISVAIKSENVLKAVGAGVTTPSYYVPVSMGSNGGFLAPGQVGIYGNADSGNGGYRQGGRGGANGRRGPGVGGVAGNGNGVNLVDGDNSRRGNTGKKKGRGREGRCQRSWGRQQPAARKWSSQRLEGTSSSSD